MYNLIQYNNMTKYTLKHFHQDESARLWHSLPKDSNQLDHREMRKRARDDGEQR